MRLTSYILTSIVCLTIVSCNQNQEEIFPHEYFDIASYFTSEALRLTTHSAEVIKTTNLNGQSDEHRFQWLDWKKEFQVFIQSDINKSAYRGKYQVDTLVTDSILNTRFIYFMSTDYKLPTKSISVELENDRILSIEIVNHSRNFLSVQDEELTYIPGEGYVIKSLIENRFTGINSVAVKGEFVNEEQIKHFN